MADLFSRQAIRLNDGVADANNAAVLNAAPVSGDYALAVRQVGVAAAAALADNAATPTTIKAATYPSGYDGTTWDMLRTTDASDGNAALTSVGILAAGVGPGFSRRFDPAALGTVIGNASAVDVNGANTAVIETNTATTGTFTIEVTVDGTTWVAALAWEVGAAAFVTGTNITPAVGKAYLISVTGMRQLRLRTVATLGGTVAHKITLSLGDVIQIAAAAAANASVNLAQVGGAAIALGQAAMAASIPVVIASNQTNVPTNIVQIGGNAVVTGGVNGTQGVGGVLAHDAAAAAALPVGVGFFASAAAPADVSADGDATKGWSLRNGSLVVNLASGGTLVTLGQKVMASSLPVVIASDQGSLPIALGASEVPALYNALDVVGSTSGTASAGTASVVTNTPANTKTAYIRSMLVAASGAGKWQLKFGATVKATVFTTQSQLTAYVRFDTPIVIAGDGATAVTIDGTNREASAMDLYARFAGIVLA